MRFSYQRNIIYKSICDVDTHPTAADTFKMVQPQIKNISLGTIYRNLAQLVDENIILELNINGVSHYDANMKPHQHFICKKCGSIIDCQPQNRWNVDNLQKIDDFDIEEVIIIFSGLCQNCKPNA